MAFFLRCVRVRACALRLRVIAFFLAFLLASSLGGAGALAVAPVDPASLVQLSGQIVPRDDASAEIVVTAQVAAGFHINAHEPLDPFLIPTDLSLVAAGSQFAAPLYPKPARRSFAFAPGKSLLVMDGRFEIRARATPAPAGPVKASLHYQACDETRCLAPVTVQIRFPEPRAGLVPAAPAAASSGIDAHLTRLLSDASLPVALGAIFLLGLGLNLTPCVYPLISVTLGYFGAQAGQRKRPWSLAIAYVLGITASFAALGTMASLAGAVIGAPLQQPLVVAALAGVMVALALSSFGLFELRMPHAIVNRLGTASTGPGGAAAMGLTMGVVAAPCIGPVVLALVVYVGARQQTGLGLLLFSVLGLGMGAPYLLLAVVADSLHRLPRAGEWLRWMNRLFGFLLLGMAIFFVRHLLPVTVVQWATAGLLATGAVYLGFLEPSGRTSGTFATLRRFGGLVTLPAAVWMVLPATLPKDAVKWEPLTLAAVDRAIGGGRPAVVEFSAQWCLPCVEMERTTFVDPAVVAEASSVAMLQADVTTSDATTDALLQRFGVAGVPTMLFFDAEGREVERVVGFLDARRMTELLRHIRGRPATTTTTTRT